MEDAIGKIEVKEKKEGQDSTEDLASRQGEVRNLRRRDDRQRGETKRCRWKDLSAAQLGGSTCEDHQD